VQHPWGSFGVNESILGPDSEGVLITRISSPAAKVIYCSASGGATSFKTSWIFTGTDFANQGMSAGIYCPDPRNRGKAASLFLDGHVELLDVKNMDQATRRKYFTLDP
jgi:prepilin-type processing-associated H-X9-DG protein